MTAALRNALGIAVAVVLGGLVGHWARPASSARSMPSAPRISKPSLETHEVAALLAPLEVGGELDGWKILGISGVQRGAVRVLTAHGRDRVLLSVTLSSDAGPRPAAVAGRYAVFYSNKGGQTLPGDVGVRVAQALARVIARNDVRPPPGLSAFRLEPRRQ